MLLLGSAWLTATLWSENLSAGWGQIDDHEIMSYLGEDHHASAVELIGYFRGSEALAPGRVPRYRPSYYFFRFLEMGLWQDDPGAWYRSRNALFFLTCFTFSLCFVWTGGLLPGAAATLVAFQPVYWAELFARLGPSETYAAPALGLFAAGCLMVLRSSQSARSPGMARFGWILISAGGAIAAMAKENFAFLPLLAAPLAWREWKNSRLDRISLSVYVISLACGFLVIYAVAVWMLNAGADVYGNAVADATVWGTPEKWRTIYLTRILPAALFVVAALVIRSERLRPWLRAVAWTEGVLLAVIAANVIFYRNLWPAGTRYGFPTEICGLLLWLAPLFLLVQHPLSPLASKRAYRAVIMLITTGILCFALYRDGFSANRGRCLANRAHTDQFTRVVGSVAEAARQQPGTVIVLRAYHLGNIESFISTSRALRFFGVKNPIIVHKPKNLSTEGLTQGTIRQLMPGMEKVWAGQLEQFSPHTVWSPGEPCLEVSATSRGIPLAGCQYFGTAW